MSRTGFKNGGGGQGGFQANSISKISNFQQIFSKYFIMSTNKKSLKVM